MFYVVPSSNDNEAEPGTVSLKSGSHSSNERETNNSTAGEDSFSSPKNNFYEGFCFLKTVSHVLIYFAVPFNDDEDEFEKWQREVTEAEAEVERLKNGSISGNVDSEFGIGDCDSVQSPREGEEEFTDDDGTTYKWDRGLRAWVPQVGCEFLNSILVVFC